MNMDATGGAGNGAELSHVHFSDANEPWSSSRHVEVLQSLNAVEKVAACLSV